MVATEIVTAIVLCVTGAIAVFLRKSKCFLREDESGNVSWGIGYTDRPIVPENPAHRAKDSRKDASSTDDETSSEHRDGGQVRPRLGPRHEGLFVSQWCVSGR
jgi:hypothetical protein